MKRNIVGWMLAGGVTAALVAGLLFVADRRAEAVPQNMNVTGYLQDGAGFPQSGEFPLRITFWKGTDAAEAPIGSHEQTVTIENGLFSLQVPVPEELLSLEAAYYSLAVDQDRDGFDAGDDFNQRNPIGSVPYALQTKPREYFATATMNINDAGSAGAQPGSRLFVGAFKSPLEGVVFDKIGIGMSYDFFPVTDPSSGTVYPNNFNFGIYDEDGNVLYHTNLTRIQKVSRYLSVTNISGRLEPSRYYYYGWGGITNSTGSFVFNTATFDVMPGFGVVNESVYNGQVPMKFDPLTIDSQDPRCMPVPLIFFKDGAFGKLPMKAAPASAPAETVQGGF